MNPVLALCGLNRMWQMACIVSGPSGGLAEAAEQLHDSAAAVSSGESLARLQGRLPSSSHILDWDLEFWL